MKGASSSRRRVKSTEAEAELNVKPRWWISQSNVEVMARPGGVGRVRHEAVTAWAKTPVGQRLTGNQLSQEASDDQEQEDSGDQNSDQEQEDSGDQNSESGGKTAEEVNSDLEKKNSDLEAENAALEAAKQDEEDSKSNWKAFGMLALGVIGGAVVVCLLADCISDDSSSGKKVPQ